jgi:hypothetical protein
MQFLTTVALSSLIFGAFSSPIAEKRQSTSAAAGVLSSLYTDIQQYTGTINSTAAGISSASTAADNSTAQDTFQSSVTSIADAVTGAVSKVQALPSEQGSTDSTNQVSEQYALIFSEVNGALNNIDATGLGKFYPFHIILD